MCLTELQSAPPPGPAYDLSFSEVRAHSLVILWKAPVYTGGSPITGYFVDMAKKGSSDFVTLNQEAVSHRYLQVSEGRDLLICDSGSLLSRCKVVSMVSCR